MMAPVRPRRSVALRPGVPRAGRVLRVGALALSLAVAGLVAGCGRSTASDVEVELLARAPERGNWSPRTLEVERGREVTLVIRNVDVVTHGFYLPALGLTASEIKAGDIVRITFTPQEAGEFPFYCARWCSDYHMDMRGLLIVR